jgi:hypothetical protein
MPPVVIGTRRQKTHWENGTKTMNHYDTKPAAIRSAEHRSIERMSCCADMEGAKNV